MNNQKLYRKYSDGNHWEKHSTSHAKKFIEFLKKSNFNGLLIDVGCGNGRDIKEFTENGINCIGIDYDKKFIESATNKFPNCKFEIQDAENMKFGDASISAIFMTNVIHYLDSEKAIQELNRILKHKGYVLIHFNLLIEDYEGKIDYVDSRENILRLFSKFRVIDEHMFERIDDEPVKHKHKILELILQKK